MAFVSYLGVVEFVKALHLIDDVGQEALVLIKRCALVGRDGGRVGRFWVLTAGWRTARGGGRVVASRVCGWFVHWGVLRMGKAKVKVCGRFLGWPGACVAGAKVEHVAFYAFSIKESTDSTSGRDGGMVRAAAYSARWLRR